MKLIKRIYGKITTVLSTYSKGNGNKVKNSSYHIVGSKFVFSGNNNIIEIAENCRITNSKFYIRGNNNRIIIGNSVHMNSGDFWIEDDGNTVCIGDSTCFTAHFHMACMEGTSITVGQDCLFAADVTVRTGDSHSILDYATKERVNKSANVIVGNHVWVGHRVTLNKGCVIPDNCIVGTCSVLTKAYTKEHAVIAGIPANVIKENVLWISDRI
jgi:acetyltransferase-like isoleucine patch superfamily enzyme